MKLLVVGFFCILFNVLGIKMFILDRFRLGGEVVVLKLFCLGLFRWFNKKRFFDVD